MCAFVGKGNCVAGDWIKMRTSLFTHPKVVRMASALRADSLRTVGGLMSVWCLFDVHSEDGRLEGYTLDAIDEHVRWEGFAAAMKAVGWLDDSDPSGLFLPHFDSHNGQSAKRRAQEADRKREGRKLSALDADKKRTREEKRREDKKEENTPRKRVDVERPESVSEQTWEDFVALRKAKHAPLTATALRRLESQAEKGGRTLEQALAMCCERGWQGYQADWDKGSTPAQTAAYRPWEGAL